MNDVSEIEKREISRQISESIYSIDQHGKVALLTAECMTALTASEARFKELKEQRFLKRMFRTIIGKNRKLEQLIQEDYYRCQYATQEILQALADRQLFTLDMISALQQRMYTLQIANERKFLTLQKVIHDVYDDTQVKVNRLQEQITRVEKLTNIIDWYVTIDQRVIADQKYKEHPIITRSMYIAHQFFLLTDGSWTNHHILYLEKVMDRLHLTESEFVTYKQVIEDKNTAYQLFKDFTGPVQMLSIYLSRPIEVLVSGVRVTNEPWLAVKVSIRQFVYELLSTLSILKELQKPVIESSYQVVLEQLTDPDLRIYVNACLHQQTKLPIEVCRNLTKNPPANITEFQTREEAEQLKKALEKYKCQITII